MASTAADSELLFNSGKGIAVFEVYGLTTTSFEPWIAECTRGLCELEPHVQKLGLILDWFHRTPYYMLKCHPQLDRLQVQRFIQRHHARLPNGVWFRGWFDRFGTAPTDTRSRIIPS